MAELLDSNGKAVWEGDDPLDLYDELAKLGEKADDHTIVGFDHTELPDEPPGEHRPKKRTTKKK